MKFILMMHMKTDAESLSTGIMSWPKPDIEAHIAFMMDFNKRRLDAGELVASEGLAFPGEATLVRSGLSGKPELDVMFPVSKEFLIGFWIVQVDTPQRAYEIAAEASAAPGMGGKPLNLPIEVRQVMEGPPEEFDA